jgi:beta-lactamase regulating signal transducer with metallopeptidase domain/ankyrin repeat protein
MTATLDSVLSFSTLALLLAKSTLIVCLAFAGAWLLRKRSGAARHTVWAVAIAMLVVVMVAAPFVPWRIGVPAFSAGIPFVATPTAAPSTAAQRASTVTTSPAPIRVAPPSAAKRAVRALRAVNWMRTLLWLWSLGIALVMARQIIARVQLSRLSRRGRVADDDSDRRFAQIARDSGITRPVTLLVSDEVDVPLTWGMFNPRVLLPNSYREWEARRFDNVLHHELAHVRRLDVFTALLGDLACALYWYNPLVWSAATQMRVEREIACDEAVLATGARASDYATDLLDLAINVRFGSLHRAGLAIAGCPRFEQRVRAIVEPVPRAGLTLAATAVIFAGVLAVLPLAAFQIGESTKQQIWPIPNAKVQEFQYAVAAGWLDKMVKMATEDPSLINSRAREGQTPLTHALGSMSKLGPAEAQWLIEHGADVNAQQGGMGSTPLMGAMRYPDIAKLLIDRGADIEATDLYDRNALDYALMSRMGWMDPERRKAFEDSIKLLRDHRAKLSFVSAIRLPDVEAVRQYLTDDPSLVHKTWPGSFGAQTAIMQAIMARRADHARYQPVLDVITSYLGEPTLCEAAMLGRTDIVAKQLDAEPSKLEKTPDGYPATPLDCALMAGERGTVQYLLNHGAKVEVMHLRAGLYTDADTMRLLISFGAAKGLRPTDLESFAQSAERMGKKDVADVLRAQK